jgi:carbonic anhydrase
MGKQLFQAMVEANHRALAGDSSAGLHPAEHEEELPLVALTCVDARLNSLLPQALGIPAEQFIWLRNAGNIITGPMSSTMRSLALACAVKGGKAIAIIGHTDCQVGKTTAMQLLDRFRALGVERHVLPDNLNEFFGIFASDRQNVIQAVEVARSSPLIGPGVSIHGLLIDVETGRLEWLVNGYERPAATSASSHLAHTVAESLKPFSTLGDFKLTELKFPDTKIGELASNIAEEMVKRIQAPSAPGVKAGDAGDLVPKPASPVGFSIGNLTIPTSKIGEMASSIGDEIARRIQAASTKPVLPQAQPQNVAPPKIPLPPPIRPRIVTRKSPK